MAIDPNTGEWVNPPPQANQGPLGGVLQIMNSMRGGDLAARSDQEQQLALERQQQQYQQMQHDYERQLGWEGAAGQLPPDASSHDVMMAGLPFSKAPGEGAFTSSMYLQPKEDTAEAARRRAEAQGTNAGANLIKAGTGARAQIAALGRTNEDSIPLLRQAGQITPEVEQALMQNPKAPYSEVAHSIVEKNVAVANERDAKAGAERIVGPVTVALKRAQIAVAQAKVAAMNGDKSAAGFIKQSQAHLDKVDAEIARLTPQDQDAMKIYKDGGKAIHALLEQKLAERSQLAEELAKAKSAMQTPAPSNTNTQSAVPMTGADYIRSKVAALAKQPAQPQQPQTPAGQ